jgi:hypothetical protein
MARLLPRSITGTWLLAAAVWLGLCGLIWTLLPPQPRAEWPDPGERYVHHVLADGPLVDTRRVPRSVKPGDHIDGPGRIFDAATGRVREIGGPGDDRPIVAVSPDCAWVVANYAGRLELSRADGGPSTELPFQAAAGPKPFLAFAFSPDIGLLAYRDEEDRQPVLRLFDLTANLPAARIAGAEWPVAFAADGRTIAYHTLTPEWIIADWPSEKIKFRCPIGNFASAELSADGSRFAQFALWEKQYWASVWNVATGRQLCNIPYEKAAYALDDLRRLVTVGRSTEDISVWDADGGALVAQPSLNGRHFALGGQGVAADGRMLVTTPDGRFAQVRDWLRRHAPWLGVAAPGFRALVIDVTTGQLMDELPGPFGHFALTPDGKSVAVLGGGVLRVYDLPLRKPLGWFAALAGILALPPAWWARHRARRLRSALGPPPQD